MRKKSEHIKDIIRMTKQKGCSLFIRCKAEMKAFKEKKWFLTAKAYAEKTPFKSNLTVGELTVIGSSVLAVFLIMVAITAALPPETRQEILKPDAEVAVQEEEVDDAVHDAYAIAIDDKDIVYLATKEDAEEVLTELTNRYKTPNSEITDLSFKENVSIEERKSDLPILLFSVGDAINYVMTGTTEPRKYVVQGGDNLWDIAIANGISPYELQEMNPDLDPKKLSVGKEIFIYETHPLVTVSFTEIVTSEERIAYNVIYEDDGSMYRGQTKVKSVGTYGSREIKSEVTKENGVVTGTKILSDTVISEPVAQIALRGTQAVPVYTGTATGQLSSPVASINVTSSYGSRGGRHHNGVDLKAAKGTPIYAAADGVVISVGSGGSFGNIVKLSHGNGLETWYAHCDTIIVSMGETVSRGQQIATIGDTGNATCYHVHFEVRVNGAVKNPMNYI